MHLNSVYGILILATKFQLVIYCDIFCDIPAVNTSSDQHGFQCWSKLVYVGLVVVLIVEKHSRAGCLYRDYIEAKYLI